MAVMKIFGAEQCVCRILSGNHRINLECAGVFPGKTPARRVLSPVGDKLSVTCGRDPQWIFVVTERRFG